MLTRRGNDWTERFEAIAAATRALPCRAALIDGEAVVYDSRGVTSFQRLQNALTGTGNEIVLVAFDLLHLDGWDLTRVPLVERKTLLERLLEDAPPTIRYGEHVTEDGAKILRCSLQARARGHRRQARRRPLSRGTHPKLAQDQMPQAGGVRHRGLHRPRRLAHGFRRIARRDARRGELAAPLRRQGRHRLRRAHAAKRCTRACEPLERRTSPVERATARGIGGGVHWVEPQLVAEITYTEWTKDGRLRHPIYAGLREDKPASEITRERATPPPKPAKPAGEALDAKRGVRLTHPDKVLFREPGITKRQLADYWLAVADVALPLLRGRPLTLFRCPDGYAAQCFYQKHVGAASRRRCRASRSRKAKTRTPRSTTYRRCWRSCRSGARAPRLGLARRAPR